MLTWADSVHKWRIHPQSGRRPGRPVWPLARVIRVRTTLLDLVLPITCPGCGTAERWCARCAAPLGARPRRLPSALADMRSAPPVYALAAYDGPVRAVVIAAKEHGRRDLPTLLGVVLGRALLRLLAIQVLSGPLLAGARPDPPGDRPPSGWRPDHRDGPRGSDRAGREWPPGRASHPAFRQRAGRAIPSDSIRPSAWPIWPAGCAGMSRAGPPPSRGVILIDDVFTTGATAQPAATTPRRRRTPVQSVVTLAAATRWFPPHRRVDRPRRAAASRPSVLAATSPRSATSHLAKSGASRSVAGTNLVRPRGRRWRLRCPEANGSRPTTSAPSRSGTRRTVWTLLSPVEMSRCRTTTGPRSARS